MSLLPFLSAKAENTTMFNLNFWDQESSENYGGRRRSLPPTASKRNGRFLILNSLERPKEKKTKKTKTTYEIMKEKFM